MGEVQIRPSNVADDKVVEVVVNRSEKLNALDTLLIANIAKSFRYLRQDDELRAVVLSGAGKAWVVGADIKEMATLDRHTAATFISNLHDAMLSIRDLPVPVIAKVHGFALGGGMELAAACDLRIASDDARFGMPEVHVGLPSVIEASLLPGLMGAGRAGRLMLTGEVIDAKRAFEWGFVESSASVHIFNNSSMNPMKQPNQKSGSCKNKIDKLLNFPISISQWLRNRKIKQP